MSEVINLWICIGGMGVGIGALLFVYVSLGRKGGHRR